MDRSIDQSSRLLNGTQHWCAREGGAGGGRLTSKFHHNPGKDVLGNGAGGENGDGNTIGVARYI